MVDRDALIGAIQSGISLTARPFARIADSLGVTEAMVIDGLRTLQEEGVIKRFGVVVRHRALGYRANAMVVWDIPDAIIDLVGENMAGESGVTLCYRRPRRPPAWPYNLFCMIHGQDRAAVRDRVRKLALKLNISTVPRAILFSLREFKQRGARYHQANESAVATMEARDA